MSKRRNKSRLTKTDVNTICEMQRKIDVYEEYIIAFAPVFKTCHGKSCKGFAFFTVSTPKDIEVPSVTTSQAAQQPAI